MKQIQYLRDDNRVPYASGMVTYSYAFGAYIFSFAYCSKQDEFHKEFARNLMDERNAVIFNLVDTICEDGRSITIIERDLKGRPISAFIPADSNDLDDFLLQIEWDFYALADRVRGFDPKMEG